jgi:nucleoid-associated protein YgaU
MPVSGTERSPTTSYDEDIYEPKAGDTYESISREFYNDTRYAVALRAYNGNQALQRGGRVMVPPLHIVKRYAQGQPAPGTPATGAPASRPTSVTTDTPQWMTPSAPAPVQRTAGNTFRVPPGGMTMRAVARQFLGSDQRWTEIWDLNPQVTNPSEILPPGTELKLPADARMPG